MVAMVCGATMTTTSLTCMAPDWLGAFSPPPTPSLAAQHEGLRFPALLDGGLYFITSSVA